MIIMAILKDTNTENITVLPPSFPTSEPSKWDLKMTFTYDNQPYVIYFTISYYEKFSQSYSITQGLPAGNDWLMPKYFSNISFTINPTSSIAYKVIFCLNYTFSNRSCDAYDYMFKYVSPYYYFAYTYFWDSAAASGNTLAITFKSVYTYPANPFPTTTTEPNGTLDA